MYGYLLIAWLLAPGSADPTLTNPRVALVANEIRVSLDFQNGLDDELLERIDSGLPTRLTYQLELARDRKRWWDAKLATTSLEVSAMYNAVAREYLVNYELDGKLIESRLARTKDELVAAMTTFDQIPAFDLTQGPDGVRLLVKVRVLMGPKTVLLIIPSRTKTDWVISSKFVIPSTP